MCPASAAGVCTPASMRDSGGEGRGKGGAGEGRGGQGRAGNRSGLVFATNQST